MYKRNLEYKEVIKLITSLVTPTAYLILGSVATLSYTKKIGYEREIHDIDIIMDRKEVTKINTLLQKRGFKKTTFINKRMPFYKSLLKKSDSKYLRFSKNNLAIEILSTDFIRDKSTLKFDLYPRIWVKIPFKYIVTSTFNDTQFATLDADLIWGIKKILHNTLGKIVKYKGSQRHDDIVALEQIIDKTQAKQKLLDCRIGWRKISIRIPIKLL